MKIEWTPDLSVGIGEIDTQHREFIRMIAELPDHIVENGETKNSVNTIVFLEDYADRHFKTEEMFMSVYSYPQADAHKDLHDMFRAEIGVMKEKAEEDAGAETINEINMKIYQWFLSHIKLTDAKLGNFLKGKMR
jgi:hemerythrin